MLSLISAEYVPNHMCFAKSGVEPSRVRIDSNKLDNTSCQPFH